MRTNIFQVLKSVLAAVLFSLVFVLVFTLIIQLFSLPLTAVKPVNQVFKVLSVAAGGLLFIRGGKGLIKGLIHGLISVVLTFLVFSLIYGLVYSLTARTYYGIVSSSDERR